jgi:DegV family protein with EDD domain
MSNVCILTDSTAQFTQPDFPGHERVHIISFDLQPQKGSALGRATAQQLIPPSPQDFIQIYTRLSREYDTIIVIAISSLLSHAIKHASSALMQYNNHAVVEVVDSQTTAVGLGMLVQGAAGAASAGASPVEIMRQVRASMPHIYMLFCIPELTYLALSGYMEHSQALVGEMMGLLPIFGIEEGRLTPLEKARTSRHMFESFQDFLSEFRSPAHIALMCGVNRSTTRTRPLRQYVQETYPETPFSEHTIRPHLAALFGPQSIGLVIMEKLSEKPS